MKQEGLKRQRRNSSNDDKISEDLLKEGNKNNIDDLLKRIKTIDRLELGLDGNVWSKQPELQRSLGFHKPFRMEMFPFGHCPEGNGDVSL
ncbi:hypothetical protein Tco_1444512, partial [Tanacetum coccineum]